MQPYIAGVVMLACIEHHLFVSVVPFWAPLIWASFCRSPVRTD